MVKRSPVGCLKAVVEESSNPDLVSPSPQSALSFSLSERCAAVGVFEDTFERALYALKHKARSYYPDKGHGWT
uniref:Uncharacterized protein n=1 Tax=Chromera velia CCMP2878 TaxID=1169474 RepID=A0A0G4HJH7_9ALVE|eukprot:Cvel_28166.t1-p1 / transcript=Cvel_28166.t1 / gene=Cvel_28166 / organism=Chromera_velia_CCMP2878 / gene_product=hypothetical protein / transcript_product=hypothetical protein / location=Cvel_scaffold3639:10396-11086(+) / protein_length=72 / sequence_SO=supercontig / SO=protein_coding / is_pseudo=false